jgi:hypothetical protein
MTAFAKEAATLSGSLLASKGMATSEGFVARPAPMFGRNFAPMPSIDRRPPAKSEGGKGGGGGKPSLGAVKLSLRLDPERHTRLRVAAAHLRRSGQEIMLAALDAYLADKAHEIRGGSCACLAARGGTGAMGQAEECGACASPTR